MARPARILVPLTIAVALALGAWALVAAKSPSYPISGSGNHCVAHLEHLTPGGPEARVTSETCFKTFSEAILFATDGRTVLPEGAEPADLTDEMLPSTEDVGTLSTWVLGVDFDRWHYDNGGRQ